jgi:hypothetical protein
LTLDIGNTLGGLVLLNFGGNAVVESSSLNLGNSTIGGNLTVMTNMLTTSGTVSVGTMSTPSTLTLEPLVANSNTNVFSVGSGLNLGAAQLNSFQGYQTLNIGANGTGMLTVSGPLTPPVASANLQLAGGGGIYVGANIATSGGSVTFLNNTVLTSPVVVTTNGVPAGNNITFQGTVDGVGQGLALNAGTAGNITFNGAVGGSGLPNQLGPLNMVGQSITGGAFNVASFTFNAPALNASGIITGLGGLAAAHQVDDLAVTTNQYFNGYQLGPNLPALAPPSTTTNGILNSLSGNLAPSTGDSGIDIGAGFEVSISAHNVDWDDPIEDLPIKPVDYLLDLEDYFSGKRAQGGSSSQGSSPSEARTDPCIAPTQDDKGCTRP